jgi:glutamate racemase
MKYFQKVADFKADTLVLGCTDFTCVRDIIDEVVGKQVTVVDPAEEVVREASGILAKRKGLHPYSGRPATSQFFITGEDHDNFSTFGAKFLGLPKIDVTRVPLTDIEKSANCAS